MEKLLSTNMQGLKTIYQNFVDDKSKDIFLKRLQYSITGDRDYMFSTGTITKVKSKLEKYGKMGKKLIMFGAGFVGKRVVENTLDYINWECFADNNVDGEVLGLKIITPDELKSKYLDAVIVISPMKSNLEIYYQLINLGFDKDYIINFGELIYKDYERQYFDILVPEINKKESFVDCGCCDGESSKLFAKWCNNHYSNIWAFEPDSSNYSICKEQLNLDNCKLYNVGAFDKQTIVRFKGGFCAGSKIIDEGENEIKTVKLDDVLKNEEITFIKMDIEGAELNALIGAEQIIRKQKPKLAICVYHKPEDIISIPKLILEYNPDYKFKLRHYGIQGAETVLYAF